jgi:hypothetical protein
MLYPVLPAKEAVRIPLLGRLIPLIARQNSAVRGVAEFASDSNEIKYLEGRFWPAEGLKRRFLLFFRVEQGNSGRGTM